MPTRILRLFFLTRQVLRTDRRPEAGRGCYQCKCSEEHPHAFGRREYAKKKNTASEHFIVSYDGSDSFFSLWQPYISQDEVDWSWVAFASIDNRVL